MESILNYIKELEKNNDRDCIAILSSLDHEMTLMTKAERLEFIKDITDKQISNLSKLMKSFLAGLIEYVYNENKLDTSAKWFMSNEYKMNSVKDNNLSKYMTDEMLNNALDNSLNEFKWRNIIQDGIFDSY